jgi:nitrite reductase/ring-hydroxylating ferredoxin subunit
MAISGTCPHWGGPLAEGKLLDGAVVECPWHASRFNLQDGRVQQGPASSPVNVFETRIRNGNVEVRRQA